MSSLNTLLLNNTRIDDDATPFLAGCTNLISLEVAGTKLTGKSIFIADIGHFDITCRGSLVSHY